jgi:hypothetical protein
MQPSDVHPILQPEHPAVSRRTGSGVGSQLVVNLRGAQISSSDAEFIPSARESMGT